MPTPRVRAVLVLCLGALFLGAAGSARSDTALLERLQPYGDFRYRAEQTNLPEDRDRFRPRVRLRLGTRVDIGHDLSVEARLVTGDPSDPRSSHQTLGLGGGKFSLNLDRANVQWRPADLPGLRLQAGKFSNPLRQPSVYRDLIQDTDVQPTGAAASYRHDDGIAFEAVVAHYVLDESSGGQESHSAVGQLGVSFGSPDEVQVNLAGDVFLAFIGDETTVDRLGHPTGRGNLVENDRFVSDFHVLHGFVELETRLSGQPLVFDAGVVHNLRADQHRNDTGWYAGALFGRLAGWRTGRVLVQFQRIEQEAVFTPWAQDDFPNNGSRFQGVGGGAGMGLTSRTSLHFWFTTTALLDAGPMESDAWASRFRLDINVGF